MRGHRAWRVASAAVMALCVATACAGDGADDTGSVPSSAARTATVTREAGGDVATDSSALRGKWLDDGNVLALVGVINARQVDAANVELGAWHSDTVRAFASALIAQHDALQHSADSLAAVLRIAPVAPALADSISASLQSRIDSLRMLRGADLDRGFLAEQVAANQIAHSYLEGLAGIAERPEVQALVTSADDQTASQLDRARGVQATVTAADSMAADSLARLRAKRRLR
ncbi:MAG TPA: DUF4142 domain-containing protein [Gemmatimonadaceae bacterium]|nr:DUF4142 domain-containing protein [Gemmatimonadaceae bacterium]